MPRVLLPVREAPAPPRGWKRNKEVAIKHAFEGARELIMAWHASVRIDFTSWRTVPLLFSSCLALRGALDREAQKPCCYASFTARFSGVPIARSDPARFACRSGP